MLLGITRNALLDKMETSLLPLLTYKSKWTQ